MIPSLPPALPSAGVRFLEHATMEEGATLARFTPALGLSTAVPVRGAFQGRIARMTSTPVGRRLAKMVGPASMA